MGGRGSLRLHVPDAKTIYLCICIPFRLYTIFFHVKLCYSTALTLRTGKWLVLSAVLSIALHLVLTLRQAKIWFHLAAICQLLLYPLPCLKGLVSSVVLLGCEMFKA